MSDEEDEDESEDGGLDIGELAADIFNNHIAPEFQKRNINPLQGNAILGMIVALHASFMLSVMSISGTRLEFQMPDGLDEEGEPYSSGEGKVP